MKIGIVGTGNMGRSLGVLWAKLGHEVFFGARALEKAKAAAELAGNGAQFGANDEAVWFGEVIFYTTRGIHPTEVLSSASSLDGKIVIDPNNSDIPEGFAYQPIEISLAEKLQAQAPQARIVKAFNTMAQEVFETTGETLRAEQVAVPIAGNDEGARRAVAQLASELGFTPIDCGDLRQARLLESFADFTRWLIFNNPTLGLMTVASFKALSAPAVQKLGGRQASNL